MVDLVGWGPTATAYAGSAPAPATTNATSVSRDAAHTNTGEQRGRLHDGSPRPRPVPRPVVAAATDRRIRPRPCARSPTSRARATPRRWSARPSPPRASSRRAYPTGGFNGYVIQTARHRRRDRPRRRTPHPTRSSSTRPAPWPHGRRRRPRRRSPARSASSTDSPSSTVAAGAALSVLDAQPRHPRSRTVAWPATDAAARGARVDARRRRQGDFTVSNTYSTNQYGEVGLAAGTTPLLQPTDARRPGFGRGRRGHRRQRRPRRHPRRRRDRSNFLSAANSGLTPPYVSLTEPVVVGAAVTLHRPGDRRLPQQRVEVQPDRTARRRRLGHRRRRVLRTRRTAAPERRRRRRAARLVQRAQLLHDARHRRSPACVRRTPTAPATASPSATAATQRGAWDAADLAAPAGRRSSRRSTPSTPTSSGLMEIENSAALGEQRRRGAPRPSSTRSTPPPAPARGRSCPSSAELPPAAEQDVITNAIIYQHRRGRARRRLPRARRPERRRRGVRERPRADRVRSSRRSAAATRSSSCVNHFKSKGSAGPWPGDADTGDGQGASNESRVRQATALRDWVADVQGDAGSAVALVGDFNSYTHEDPLQVLYDAGYTDAASALAADSTRTRFCGAVGLARPRPAQRRRARRAPPAPTSGTSTPASPSRWSTAGTTTTAPTSTPRTPTGRPTTTRWSSGLAAGASARRST